MIEQWLDIQGWEGAYQVSNRGAVRSLDRTVIARNPQGVLAQRRYRGRILSAANGSHGYRSVSLVAPGRKRETRCVHELVASHFLPPPATGQIWIRHLDGNKQNCCADNLAWGTPAENSRDCILHGQQNPARGERSGHAKLSDDLVTWILRNKGVRSQRSMARELGVTHGVIGAVLRGEAWRHVERIN